MSFSKRNLIIPTAIAAAVTCSLSTAEAADPKARPVTIAVFGDAPYGTNPTDTSELMATPAFVDAVNADPEVELVVHVGDIHSGKQYCTEFYDRTVYDLWSHFADPLIYTPGDNEWTDCHKAAEGGGTYDATSGQIKYVLDSSGAPVDYASGDPVENLKLVRSVFFPKPGLTLGGGRKIVLSQGLLYDPRHPSDRNYVENVMWEQNRVLFVTINLPGGSNNDQDVWYGAPVETAAQTTEREQRTGADLRWLDSAFLVARVTGVKAVAIIAQADMWDPEKGAAHQTGYEDFVRNIAENTTTFGRPVLLLNGDSHVYRSDNPLSANDPLNYMHPGYDVSNFHRVVVHGSTFPLEYLRLKVNPADNWPNGNDAFGPFSWERQIEQ